MGFVASIDDHRSYGLRSRCVHEVAQHVRVRIHLGSVESMDDDVGSLTDLEGSDAILQADGSSSRARGHAKDILREEIGPVLVGGPGRQQCQIRLPEQVEGVRPVRRVRSQRDVGPAAPQLGVVATERAVMPPHHRGCRRPGQAGAEIYEEVVLRVGEMVGVGHRDVAVEETDVGQVDEWVSAVAHAIGGRVGGTVSVVHVDDGARSVRLALGFEQQLLTRGAEPDDRDVTPNKGVGIAVTAKRSAEPGERTIECGG